jgi:flagellar protein FlaG
MLIQQVGGPMPSIAQAPEGVAATGVTRNAEPPLSIPGGGRTDTGEISPDVARAAVANANRTIQAFTSALEFEIDGDTGKVVIRLVDTQDHRVLRQVPAPEMLEIARALERMQSLLIRGKA